MRSLAFLSRIAPLAAALMLAGCDGGEQLAIGGEDCASQVGAKVGGDFRLTGHDGTRISAANFTDRQTLVFFGYTHCPDACPATLAKLGSVMQMLPKGAETPHVLLISIDPARDALDQLATYVNSNGFPEDVTGATGTEDELQSVASAFAAPFGREEDTGPGAGDAVSGYLMSHSNLLYLMDKDWKLQTFFWPAAKPQAMARCIAAFQKT